MKKKQNAEEQEAEDKKSGYDPNAIMLRLVDLIKLTHGSIESKAKLIDDFHEAFPECTKNSIERRIKEFFVKDRRGDDPKLRYYASDELLAIE